MKKFIGIDIGGMSIKGVLTNTKGEILYEDHEKTRISDCVTINGMVTMLINRMLNNSGHRITDISGIGLGCPGMVDSEKGTIVFAGNLGIKNYPLAEILKNRTGLVVKIANDAHVAALGEAKFGAGKIYKNSVLVTLGTGIGGGIIINRKLFEGGQSAGTEIGHMVIDKSGLKCTCGRAGCFECYASATALIRKTREAMQENRNSAMWQEFNLDNVSGKTAFKYMDQDESAKEVIDWYIENLACGLTNIANIFRPEVIMLGGGISAEGERLTKPLQELMNKAIFAGVQYAPVKIITAMLGNRAGALGAAALNM